MLQEDDDLDGPVLEHIQYGEEEDCDNFSPEGTVKIITVDAETNTDTRQGGPEIKRRSDDSTRNSAIKRSQTFSPAGRPGNDYICKVSIDEKFKCCLKKNYYFKTFTVKVLFYYHYMSTYIYILFNTWLDYMSFFL